MDFNDNLNDINLVRAKTNLVSTRRPLVELDMDCVHPRVELGWIVIGRFCRIFCELDLVGNREMISMAISWKNINEAHRLIFIKSNY